MHDVLVVGAGPGGSAAAFYLARAGLDVALIDRQEFPRDKTCGDALTPRATAVLVEMGLLDQVRRAGNVVRSFRVFAPNQRSTGVLMAGDQTALSVRRLLLDDILMRGAADAGAAFEPLVEAATIEQDGRSVRVKAARKGREVEFSARVGVLATGAALRLPLAAGLAPRQPRFMVAGRAYFEAVEAPDDWEIRCHDVPLPGYAWVSPVADHLLNIGVGYMPGPRRVPIPASVQAFTSSPSLRDRLVGAKAVGPIKSYPLRSDFTIAKTQVGRIFAVGEAAGLANPLTGEGIDYALESGRLAAEQIVEIFSNGDFLADRSTAYDRQLRARYQSLFRFCETLRLFCGSRLALNLVVALADRRPDLKDGLVKRLLDPDPGDFQRRLARVSGRRGE